MHQEHQGRAALFSFIRGASRLGLLALAIACLSLPASASAARKAAAGKPAAPAAAAPDKAAPKVEPGEALAKTILSRGMASGKDNLAVLLPLTGTWDYLESIWTDPNVTPPQSIGTVTADMVLGEHFLLLKSQGTISIGNQLEPFEAQEFIGYDTATKSFSAVTLDTLTTGMMVGAATFDPKKQTLTEKGRFTNPLTGTEQAYRAELTWTDATHYKRTVFAAGKTGKETKLIEIDYTKRD